MSRTVSDRAEQLANVPAIREVLHSVDCDVISGKHLIDAVLDHMETALKDPVSVHLNMLRGSVAAPSLRQMLHVYGNGAIEAFDIVLAYAESHFSGPEVDRLKELSNA